MMKREFEQAYGRKVSDSRWAKIEKAYMESDYIDRLDFVAELKASEADARFKKEAASGSIELERHGLTEAQFRAYVRARLKGHPLEGWRDWITPEIGHGDFPYRSTRYDWGADGIHQDINGKFQEYMRYDDGKCTNLIFEFEQYEEDGRGFGYCYIFDTTIPGFGSKVSCGTK